MVRVAETVTKKKKIVIVMKRVYRFKAIFTERTKIFLQEIFQIFLATYRGVSYKLRDWYVQGPQVLQ